MALPTDPVAPLFPAGYGPQPADFATWVQAPLAFLTSKVVFRAELSSGLTLVNGASTVIPFDVILEDPYSGWNAGTSAWTCPAGCSGVYDVSVTVSCQAPGNATSSVTAGFRVSGSNFYSLSVSWSDTQKSLASSCAPVQIYGGVDTIQATGFFSGTANGAAATTAGQRCTIEVISISL